MVMLRLIMGEVPMKAPPDNDRVVSTVKYWGKDQRENVLSRTSVIVSPNSGICKFDLRVLAGGLLSAEERLRPCLRQTLVVSSR